MDDMVFQNNNKNTIYVLNTSYNTYGEFGCPNAFGYPQISTDEIYNNSKNCSLSRSLHKLKSLRHHSREMIPGSSANTAEGNPSSAATYYSPAAAALQKLFNCSSTAHSCKSINYKNNNCHSKSHLHHDLSHHGSRTEDHRHAHQETGKPLLEYHHLESQMPSLRSNNGTSRTSCVLPGVGSGNKKHSNSTTSVKSTLIAKKTKFWKYLVEEEKWRKHSVENLSTTNCERDCDRSIGKSSSNHSGMNNSPTSAHSGDKNTHNGLGAISNHSSKNNSSSCNGNSIRISYWSGNADTNKTNNDGSNQKSSTELYKEAAQLLGLSCTLCDNCRCLDCQSRYFECDDSDNYSEFSFMDEYYEALQDVDGNLTEVHSRHSSSRSLQHSQDDDASVSDDQPTNDYLKNSVLDHCESFNDLSLENSVESED